MRRLTILVALVGLVVVAVAGIAFADTLVLGPENDVFVEDNTEGCESDDITADGGKDSLYFNTSNETNCPNGDFDRGAAQEGPRDLVNVADTDTFDTAGGGPGGGDRCIITLDQNGTADPSDDQRDNFGLECEIVREVIYNPPQ
jgi:hypothetical protein